MNYVALDFETANSYPGGACSVALARFDEEGGSLLETYYTLIRPKHPYFDPGMTAVHKLSSDECLAAPEFDQIWGGDMRTFIGRDILVAHNAVFDMGVMKAAFEAYDLEAREMSYLCTLIIARKLWPKMHSYKLSYLVDYFDMEYQAHYALDDAIMCGKIMYRLCQGHLNELLDLRRFLITKGIEPKVIEHQRKDADFSYKRIESGCPEPYEAVSHKPSYCIQGLWDDYLRAHNQKHYNQADKIAGNLLSQCPFGQELDLLVFKCETKIATSTKGQYLHQVIECCLICREKVKQDTEYSSTYGKDGP